MDTSTWLTFFFATLAISVAPGPGALAAMGAGLQHGFARGQPVAFGLALGVVTQLMVVGVGLGALLATSEAAFSVVKWLGAAYLVWLGVQQWRAPARPLGVPEAEPLADSQPLAVGSSKAPSPQRLADQGRSPQRTVFLRGWMVNALNPKGTVFLLAVMPQFLHPTEPLAPQYLAIGVTFSLVECVVMTGYVALAARLLGVLRSPRHIGWMNRGFGSLFVLAGVALAGFRRSA